MQVKVNIWGLKNREQENNSLIDLNEMVVAWSCTSVNLTLNQWIYATVLVFRILVENSRKISVYISHRYLLWL